MITIETYIVTGLICYLLGSIPTAYIITRLVKGTDIRDYGSGNPGATNVIRSVGKTAGVITFIVDFLKGFAPVLAVKTRFHETPLIIIYCGLLVIAGHIWTVFLGFRGGKGVATGAGVLYAIMPSIAIIGSVTFLLSFFITRTVSICSIISILAIIITAWIFNRQAAFNIFITAAGLIIILRHASNIKRILRKEEKEITNGQNRQ